MAPVLPAMVAVRMLDAEICLVLNSTMPLGPLNLDSGSLENLQTLLCRCSAELDKRRTLGYKSRYHLVDFAYS